MKYTKKGLTDGLKNAYSFVVPKKPGMKEVLETFESKKIVAIIPTYKPLDITLQLTKEIHSYHKNIMIIVVDDSTPENSESSEILKKIKNYSKNKYNIKLLRTPSNQYKSGALNLGLEYVRNKNLNPDVIITSDDDVEITANTLPVLVDALCCDEKLGVVCTNVRIKNKNTNLLTRLQGLEYHNFNLTKLSDNGFFQGPLVMQGMLVAFRYSALEKVEKFDQANIIEDYEITARIKKENWHVAIVPKSWAWTRVPEEITSLWKQRVRWSYGGLTVIEKHFDYKSSIIQDLLGHSMFLSLLVLIILTFIVQKGNEVPGILVKAILFVALSQFAISQFFSLYTLKHYKDLDVSDFIIRFVIFPEFIYNCFLSFIVLGSYLFYIFNLSFSKIYKLRLIYQKGLLIFSKAGFSLSWGTRQ
jgi:poly-beta-1,6-N-acetyl-D-glucosamine synthase